MKPLARLGALAFAVLATTNIVPAPAGAAGGELLAQQGVWATNFPCTIVDYDIASNEFACVGSNDWAGPTMNGVTYYTMVGTLDPQTGDAKGTIDERFVGAVGTSYGTLHFHEEFANRAGQITITANPMAGTGALKGFSDTVQLSGVWTLFTGGGGTFS